MAKATGFFHDPVSGNIRMNQGDTGSYMVHCARKSGETWPETARMLYTISNSQGEIVIQRIYRMDDQWDLGDGVVLVEFHNSDTDELPVGTYSTERRYDISPTWEGTPSTARCVDALAAGAAKMIDGATVRTVFQGTLTIENVNGRI